MSSPPNKLRFHPLDYASALAFVSYAAGATATPVCLVALSREISFSLTDGGILESMRSGLVILTLLLSGFIAARFGKVRSLGCSCMLLALALTIYTVAPLYSFILLAMVLLGVGGGVVEALINPLIGELHHKDSGRYLSILNAFWSIGVLLTVLLTGELLTRGISWRYIMGTVAALSLLSGILFFILRNTGPPRHTISMTDVFQHKKEILSSAHFLMFAAMMFFGGAAEGALTFWSASYIQIQHGGLPRAAGFGVAIFAGGMIVGRLASGWLIRQHLLRRLILVSAIAGTAISCLLPLVNSVGGVYMVLFFAGLSVACFWPGIQAYAVDSLPFDATAVFILLSCGGIAGFGFSSWLIGFLADQFSFSAALFVIPAFFAILAALLLVPKARRNG